MNKIDRYIMNKDLEDWYPPNGFNKDLKKNEKEVVEFKRDCYPKLIAKDLVDVMPIEKPDIIKQIFNGTYVPPKPVRYPELEAKYKDYVLKNEWQVSDGSVFEKEYRYIELSIDDLIPMDDYKLMSQKERMDGIHEYEYILDKYDLCLHISKKGYDEIRNLFTEGDKIYYYASPSWTWSSLCGRAGIALIRDGKFLKNEVVRFS